MKTVFLFMLVCGLTTAVGFGQTKETREVSNFTGVDASSVFDITVSKGDSESLTIEAHDELMPYVRSEVRNGVLHLHIDRPLIADILNNSMYKNLKAIIVMKDLERVSLSGACKFTANDLFTPVKFKGECSGASGMSVNIDTGSLDVDVSGAATIRLKANVNGKADIDVSGAAKIRGEVNAVGMEIDSSGACSAELTGTAEYLEIDVSGTATVRMGDFAVKTASIESSGTSDITVNVSERLNVESSGMSSVKYKGSPSVNVKNGRSAKVKQI